LTETGPKNAITPRHVAAVLWRQKVACALAFGTILIIGSAVVLTRPTVYQSNSSVALLPASKNPSILPNYPNLIISLVPTYVQLASSPVLLDKVAANVPFSTTGEQLAQDVHAESLSNAAIINIVAEAPGPAQAQEIAASATRVFLTQIRGNGVVVPRIYGQPTAARPAPPSKALLLSVVVLLAVVLGAAAGLFWDRFADLVSWSGRRAATTARAVLRDRRAKPHRAPAPSERAAAMTSGAAGPIEPFETVKLRPSSRETGKPPSNGMGKRGAPGEGGRSRTPGEARKPRAQ
jgi:capsular polysaccharide biosynthesis protein